MIEHRPFVALGRADHGWLQARYHFSFADDHDPARMGWGALRVWNDDVVAAGHGFPAHPHRDMQIVTDRGNQRPLKWACTIEQTCVDCTSKDICNENNAAYDKHHYFTGNYNDSGRRSGMAPCKWSLRQSGE